MSATAEKKPLLSNNKQSTPLPFELFIIALISFGNAFSIILVYPFLPFMIADLFPELSPRALGYKTGYLASVFSIGVFLSSYFWGVLADRIGRRPVLTWGCFFIFCFVLAFGMSTSFTFALCMRFFWGIASGSVAVAKTYLSEILDETNTARGFSVFGLMFSMGRLFAPVIAGFLSKPADKYKLFDIALFRDFPYLLPCLVAAALAFVGFCGALLWLKETLHREPQTKVQVDAEAGGAKATAQAEFNYKAVFLASFLYMLLAFVSMMWVDTFPLWVLNSPKDGGFNFDTSDIGIVFTVCAPFEMFNMLVLYPRFAEKLSLTSCIRFGFAGIAVMLFLIPFTTFIATYSAPIRWVSLCVSYLLLTGFFDYSFNTVFMLINNSTTKAYRGRVNGASGQMAAIGRTIAPTLASILFAWSETNGLMFPFNFHFVFCLASLLSVGGVGITFFLPESLNQAPIED